VTDSTYSQVGDLLIGEFKTHRAISAQQYVNDAADEIDSHLGSRYATPIDMSDVGPVSRPSRLIIKRIAAHLSSGRLLLAASLTSDDSSLKAYASKMVCDALEALNELKSGNPPLEGALPGPGVSEDSTGVFITNVDPVSRVEFMYDFMAGKPLLPAGFVLPPWMGG
jgi:hypothetical protein